MAADTFFIPGLVRIVVRATSEGSNRITVFHFKTTATGPLTVSDLLALAQSFWTAVIAPLYKPMVGAHINFEEVTATDRSAAGLNTATYTPPQPQAGTAAGDALPANTALVVSNRTGKTGRRNRGRIYLYGQTEAQASGSFVNSSYVTAALTLWQAIVNWGGTLAIPCEYVVASKTFLVMTRIISAVANIYIDSQRNRLVNRGY